STAMGLAGLGATVKFGGFLPRAVTGTLNKSLPHIPFGAGWSPGFAVPIKKNHGKVFLGSLFVSADGDPMAGMGHLNYDCWDIGIPDLFKSQRNAAKKSPDPPGAQAELFVPSGTILPIPWSRPVLVNSVPTPINPLSSGERLFKAGLGKLKKLRAMGEFRKKTQNNPTIPCSKRVPLSDSDFSAFYERQKKEKAKKKKGKLDEIKPTPTFTKNQPHHNAKEFRKQVDMQQDAINKMSVREWLDNREAFDNLREKAKKGDKDAIKKIKDNDKAAKKERNKFRKEQTNKIAKSIKRSNPNLSDKQAKQKAKEYLKGKDALHELDAVGGGYNKVTRMGDSGINRSIGSQWKKKGIANNIENQVREQIKNMGIQIPPNSNIPKDLMMNVKL
ncbi:polymorphic toxin type 15 domain-containing protein, partial [Capnocytophaga canis]|uniref:polymorphic toxin type 15 domain-containing protein n=1 Tax=Capnocytophaga canis TaxID=1848903 RepID=UPI001F5052A9